MEEQFNESYIQKIMQADLFYNTIDKLKETHWAQRTTAAGYFKLH